MASKKGKKVPSASTLPPQADARSRRREVYREAFLENLSVNKHYLEFTKQITKMQHCQVGHSDDSRRHREQAKFAKYKTIADQHWRVVDKYLTPQFMERMAARAEEERLTHELDAAKHAKPEANGVSGFTYILERIEHRRAAAGIAAPGEDGSVVSSGSHDEPSRSGGSGQA